MERLFGKDLLLNSCDVGLVELSAIFLNLRDLELTGVKVFNCSCCIEFSFYAIVIGELLLASVFACIVVLRNFIFSKLGSFVSRRVLGDLLL